MISNWKYDYSNEEKGLALTILNLNEEIKKLVDEAEEQDRHIKEANIEIESLNNIMTKLEIELYTKYHEHKDSECEELYAKAQEDKEILDYIRELKEGNKK